MRHGERVRLTVLEFSDSWPKQDETEGEAVFEYEGKLDEVASAFVSGMQRVLDEWGEAGYLKEWIEYPFPTELLRLVGSRLSGA